MFIVCYVNVVYQVHVVCAFIKQKSQSVKSVIVNFSKRFLWLYFATFACCDDFDEWRQEFVTFALAVSGSVRLFCLDFCISHSDKRHYGTSQPVSHADCRQFFHTFIRECCAQCKAHGMNHGIRWRKRFTFVFFFVQLWQRLHTALLVTVLHYQYLFLSNNSNN